MNVSVNWLRELAPGLSDAPEALAHRLSMVAAAVEQITVVGEGLEEIVVARVLEAAPHPNADRLTLCRVDVGEGEPIDVVCGAPIVLEGALYPYVGPGVTLPGGFTIEARKIRGEVSHGMLCSEYELEIGRDRGGIMRLPDELEPGASLADALGLPDARLSLDINPNRVDLACHAGVARELAEGGEAALALEELGRSWDPRWADGEPTASAAGVGVTLEDLDRCPRYLAAIVRGVRIGPSPAWLAGRLLAIGSRPINNVVDATNYVLFELNQPIHAFDLATLGGPEIRVRAARPGETLRTLDGEDRKLGPRITVIADEEKPVALAGVMGGEATEVTDGTTELLIECASFGPLHVRDTVRELTLPTDASYRFERQTDESGMERALRRCVEIILSVAGGDADPSGIRAGRPARVHPAQPLRSARVRQVLGIEPSEDEIRALLAPIGFTPAEPPESEAVEGATYYSVPGWRNDVTREIDLIEEVARRFGFDNFPAEDRRFRPSAVSDDPAWDQADEARAALSALGLLEARSSSFVPQELAGTTAQVGVLHPLSAEEGYLRSGVVPVLVRRAEYNFARGNRDVRLYEIGTVFGLRDAPEAGRNGDSPDSREAGTARYAEELRLGALITGTRAPRHWSEAPVDVDLWDLKGLAAEIAERLAHGEIEPAGTDDLDDWEGWLGAERFRIVRDGETIGVAGRVDPGVVDAPPWAGAVWGLELRLAAIVAGEAVHHHDLPAFPAVHRDLAITVPLAAEASAVGRRIHDTAPELLESARLFDVYEGEGVENGRRSLAWAFTFRSSERTLTDDEVDGAMSRITEALQETFDARIRTG